MKVDTDLMQTPLQNLFYYIRDLYNARRDCLDYTLEPGNPKTRDVDYWEVGEWLQLARQCARQHIPEFDLAMATDTEQHLDCIVKIRRVPLPAAPAPPLERGETGPDQGSYERSVREFRQKYAVPLRINDYYDALHALSYELKGRSNKRLFLSFGLINGMIGERSYRNFLFHVPLRLILRNHEIRIEADTFAQKIYSEQFFTDLLDVHFASEAPSVVEERKKEVLLAVDRFNAQTLDAYFNPDFIRTEYFNKGWDMLAVFPQKEAAFFKGDALDYTFAADPIKRQLTFSFSPVIQTKIVADQMAISKDASAVIRSINELQKEGALHRVPDFFKKLFSIPTETPQQAPVVRIKENKGEEVPYRFLFPLPYNQEQFDIAQRLLEQDAVTVKGPPGTGKSHTIANLIAHFVSEGQSILVVSHNAKALSVLKDKLPKGIQDLAVSLVNEGKGNDGLKASVSSIIRHISGRYDVSRIEALEGQLSMLENKYALLLSEMYKIVRSNAEVLALPDPQTGLMEERSAYEWAVHVHEQAAYSPTLLKDPVDYTTDTTGLSESLQTLTVIANQFQPEDFDLIHYHFLQDHAFPDLKKLRSIEIRLEEITREIQLDDYARIDPSVADDLFLEEFSGLSEQWAILERSSFAKDLLLHPDFDRSSLWQMLQDNAPYRMQINAAEDTLMACDIDMSPLHDIDPDILYRQINQLIVKFGGHRSMGWMSRNLLDKSLRLFFACRVNYIAATEIEQFRLLETAINRERCLKQLAITFQNYLRRFGILAPATRDVLKELDLLAGFMEILAEFNVALRQRGLSPLDPTAPAFGVQWLFVGGLTHYAAYGKIREFLTQAKDRLIDHSTAHPLIFNIARAIEYVNRANFELYLNQYRDKRQKQPAAIRFDQLYKEVSRLLPHTALYIKDRGLAGVRLFPPHTDIEEDLFCARLHSFLTHIVSRTKGTASLLQDLQTAKRGIERQTAELISYKAWYNKSNKVSDLQKTALNAWLNDLINIGKGYGKNTARNMASAIRNMQIAKEAVPIWIMPQETAVTFFPDATPGQFDLLIIDEASQCDISSLNLVYRCRKCLIVGDENQTSVMTDHSWFTIDRTNDLLDKYLIAHHFKTQFDVNNKNNSIYTLSGVIYPNIVTLTEHFRCLPEIIGYANQYVYNHEIVPLKTATERTFGDPIDIVYTEDDPDDDDKPLMVRKVVEAIERYIRDFREGHLRRLPTIGILTLDSSNQGHRHALLKAIGHNELIKQYEDSLELLIGTSREFQGDERDVMLLTTTASHSVRKEGEHYALRPPRAASTEEYMRIYNVASSRAKERSVLFHSIHPDAVALMNPDCFRKRLIDYYALKASRRPTASKVNQSLPALLEQVDIYSGTFHSSVCRFLYEQGWGNYLFPQMEIGKYRIDFGLIIGNRKLALECDGGMHNAGLDKIRDDIDRQLILERANWHFFRIQSTDWYYRRQEVGEALLHWIRENSGDHFST